MSKAFECNACGDLVTGSPKTVLFQFNDLGEQEDSHDYCEECSKKKGLV